MLQNGGGFTTSAAVEVKVTPVIEAERLDNGFVIIQLFDARSLDWKVQASADLNTWQELGPMTFTDGLGVFVDATAGAQAHRFYRVLAQ